MNPQPTEQTGQRAARRGRTGLAGQTRRWRRRRGAGFLMFVLVGFPFVFFAAFIAFDASRIYMANRQAENIAEASALAGSFAFTSGQARLEPTLAVYEANDTCQFSFSTNAGSLLDNPRCTSYPDFALQTVTVTLDYQLDGLSFLAVLSSFLTGNRQELGSYRVTRQAYVCQAGISGIDLAYCTRPGDPGRL